MFRGYEASVKFHAEEAGLLVELHPGDARDSFNFGAHGVGAARSENAAFLLHAGNLKGHPG